MRMYKKDNEGHAPEPGAGHDPGYVAGPAHEEIDTSAGFEQADVRVKGIVVFLISLGVFVAVTGGLCYVIGMWLNGILDKQDGPNSKWTKTAEIRQLGNLANNPAMQSKVYELTQQFPTPRLQEDDGYEEIVQLHAREDILLKNYSWVDPSHTKVRIPIDQAMIIIAHQGLPVATATDQTPLLTGEIKPAVKAPLTNGFARTGYEQDQGKGEEMEDARGKHP
jgi:hypothetical protein